MKKPRKRLIILLAIIVVLAGFSIWVWHSNVTVGTTFYAVSSEDLPKNFDGFTIVQVSDLHNDIFGEDNCDLIEAINNSHPDIIVITGDLIDSYNMDIDIVRNFIDNVVTIAPVYYITGNHEYRFPITFEEFEEYATNAGVTVLRDESTEFALDGESINIIGIDDPVFSGIKDFEETSYFAEKTASLVPDDGFSLLLSHRHNILDVYCISGADLVLSGHAHGGQFRVPFLGGLFTFKQGLFPEYTEGIFEKNDTVLIVSRGLGNSAFPFRINNPPELVVVTLEAK